MKKIVLSVALLAGAATAANAQAAFGVKAGVVAATISGDNTEEADNRFGFQVGATANFGINDMFSFQPELLYSQKGFQFEGDGAETKTTFHYIDLPLLARLNAGGLFFEAGPQLGYLVGQKTEFDVAGVGSGSSDETDGLRKLDVGYIAGLGYQLESGLSLGIRYNGGITNINDIDDEDDSDKIRNSVFQFQVGYTFGGK